MPWSPKQHRLFAAAATNPEVAKRTGIKQADAKRMMGEGIKKAKGGGINIVNTRHGELDLPVASNRRFRGMKKGGRIPVNGSDSVMHVSQGPTKMSVDKPKLLRRPTVSLPYSNDSKYEGMARGGSVSKKFEGSAEDEAQDKKLAKKHGMSFDKWEASKMDVKHDKQESMKGLRRGGASKGYCAGGGIEVRGKTRGRMV